MSKVKFRDKMMNRLLLLAEYEAKTELARVVDRAASAHVIIESNIERGSREVSNRYCGWRMALEEVAAEMNVTQCEEVARAHLSNSGPM